MKFLSFSFLPKDATGVSGIPCWAEDFLEHQECLSFQSRIGIFSLISFEFLFGDGTTHWYEHSPDVSSLCKDVAILNGLSESDFSCVVCACREEQTGFQPTPTFVQAIVC